MARTHSTSRPHVRRRVDRSNQDTTDTSSAQALPRALGLAVLLVVLLIAISQWVISQQGSWVGAGSVVKPFTNGEQLLRELSRRYQELTSYEDRMLMRLLIPLEGTYREEVADLLTRYVRPNKLRLHINRQATQMLITSDGEQLQTRILDELSRDFDGQFLQQQAPESISLGTLLTATEFVTVEQPDQLHSILMSLPCPLPVSQLTLLWDDQLMEQLMSTSKSVDRLPDRNLGEMPCARVRVWSPAGYFVFWIDLAEGMLRRLEYPGPAGEIAADGSNTAAPATAKLTADFDNIVINRAFPPTSFRQQAPKHATFVRHFVVPPADEVATVLGRRVTQYWFTDLNGQQVTAAELRGPITAMVWFNDRPPSRQMLETLAEVYRHLDAEAIRLLAVCTEPSTAMSHDDIRRLGQRWNLPFPVVRDLEAFGRDAFGVTQAPTLVILDENSVVQVLEVGGSGDWREELPIVFEKLLSGEPLASNYLDFLAGRREKYRLLLAAAGVNAPQTGAEQFVPRNRSADSGAAAPHPSPVYPTVRLNREWSTRVADAPLAEVKLVHGDREQWLLVSSADQAVHDVALHGQRRESFPLGAMRQPFTLRVAAKHPARAGFATMGQEGILHFFSDRGAMRWSYPASSGSQQRVTDAVIADLDENGQAEVYVVLNQREVQRLGGDGRVVWSSLPMNEVTSLCVSHDRSGQQYLMVTHQGRSVTPFAADGALFESIALDFPVRRLHASRRTSEDGAFCAVSTRSDGSSAIVGCDAAFERIWSHSLPARAVDAEWFAVVWVPWEQRQQQGFWLISDSQRQLTAISEDGSLMRTIPLEAPVAGFCGYHAAGKNMLCVTQYDALVCFDVGL